MATPVIRVAPAHQLASSGGYNAAISGENIGAAAASFLKFTAAIGGYAFQTAAAAHSAVGTNQNVTLTTHTDRGPDHCSITAMVASRLQTGNSWSMCVNGTANRWYLGNSDDYQIRYGQAILDSTSTPDLGSARTVGQGTTNISMAFNATNGGENMFETFASAFSWVGKHIEIDGGTSGSPIDFAGVSAEDRFATTRTAAAPYRGNYYGHVIDIGGTNIEMRGPVIIGHANGTTPTYFKDTSLSIACNGSNRVNDKWYYIESQGNTTMIFGDSASPTPGTVAGTGTKKLRLDTATDEPDGGFFSYNRTWINGRAWKLGSNSEFHNGGLNNIDSVAMNATTKLLDMTILQARLDYAEPPTTGSLTGSVFGDPADYCIVIGSSGSPTNATTMTIDYGFLASAKGAGKAIHFYINGQTLNVSFAGSVGSGQKISAADITITDVGSGGSVVFPAAGRTFGFIVHPSITGYEWRLYEDSGVSGVIGTIELAGEESSASVDHLTAYGYTYTADTNAVLQIIANGYEEYLSYVTLADANLILPIELIPEKNT